jgi:hypothetical protein
MIGKRIKTPKSATQLFVEMEESFMRKRTSSNLPLPEFDGYRSSMKQNPRVQNLLIFAVGLLIGMLVQPRLGIFSSSNHEIASWKYKHTGNEK